MSDRPAAGSYGIERNTYKKAPSNNKRHQNHKTLVQGKKSRHQEEGDMAATAGGAAHDEVDWRNPSRWPTFPPSAEENRSRETCFSGERETGPLTPLHGAASSPEQATTSSGIAYTTNEWRCYYTLRFPPGPVHAPKAASRRFWGAPRCRRLERSRPPR
ncbi:hypothetical protein MRX96_028695 [Rhipicephalus microplus]